MPSDWVLDAIDKLKVWSRRGERAPHKPLLLLFALGRLQRGEPDRIAFSELYEPLSKLLIEYGPARKSTHPEYPFWHLQTDGLWKVEASEPIRVHAARSNPTANELIRAGATGRFPSKVRARLLRAPSFIKQAAMHVMSAHFPTSLHTDILASVGLDADAASAVSRRRDPSFRDRVLRLYEFRCSVCELDLRLGSSTALLEAAHIRWYQANGPDVEQNALALCVIHHKAFDLGAFTAEPDGTLLVSDLVNGSSAQVNEIMLRHHGSRLRSPQRPNMRPSEEFLAWHQREVFKGSPRHRG